MRTLSQGSPLFCLNDQTDKTLVISTACRLTSALLEKSLCGTYYVRPYGLPSGTPPQMTLVQSWRVNERIDLDFPLFLVMQWKRPPSGLRALMLRWTKVEFFKEWHACTISSMYLSLPSMWLAKDSCPQEWRVDAWPYLVRDMPRVQPHPTREIVRHYVRAGDSKATECHPEVTISISNLLFQPGRPTSYDPAAIPWDVLVVAGSGYSLERKGDHHWISNSWKNVTV